MHKVIKIVLLLLSVFSFQTQPYFSYPRRHNSEQSRVRENMWLKKQAEATCEERKHNNSRITDHRIVGVGWKTVLVSGLIAVIAFIGGFFSLLIPIASSMRNWKI